MLYSFQTQIFIVRALINHICHQMNKNTTNKKMISMTKKDALIKKMRYSYLHFSMEPSGIWIIFYVCLFSFFTVHHKLLSVVR